MKPSQGPQAVFGFAAIIGLWGVDAQACANDLATACKTATGSYHIALPEGATDGLPALLWLHGMGGNGQGILRNPALMDPLLEGGYAVIGANGSPMTGRNGRRWNFLPGRAGDSRDEKAFLAEITADVATRFGIDPEKVILGGFSNGAFAVHYLACDDPGAFARYAPVAGGFWRPHPENCQQGPVKLFQTHGWADGTVPLEGRPLGNGRFLQGDIFGTLEIWRDVNGCVDPSPDKTWRDGKFLRREWHECASGGALDMALFDGGHTVPAGWSELLLEWVDATGD